MFWKDIRLLLNHLRRIDKAHDKLVSTRAIVEKRDLLHKQLLEAERQEKAGLTVLYKAKLEEIKWVLKEDG